jgi:hypothetical protein
VRRAETAHPAPFARAVIRDGRITLNPWRPGLLTGGPQRVVLAPLAERHVVMADLSCEPTDGVREELRVEWVPAGGGNAEAAARLEQWAERVGYARLWLPDRVVELQQELFTGGRAAVTCPTCSLSWDDESPHFWASVRTSGYFPGFCPACNGSLPEWELEPAVLSEPVDDQVEIAF